MKHLVYAAAAAALLATAACGGSSAGISAEKTGFDSLFSAQQADSFITSFAQVEGLTNNSRFDIAAERMPQLSKSDFMAGFKHAFFADTTSAFQYGMQTASMIASRINDLEKRGIVVDRKAFFDTFSQCFMAQDVTDQQVTDAHEAMNYYNLKFNEALRAYERAQRESAPEALDNAAAGTAYIDSVAGADKGVKINENGVGIKIIDEGKGEKVKPSDMVLLHYEASTPDGRVFDRADSNNARPVSVATRVNGLQQALALLGKGGKAEVYIPGKEAFGVDANRRFRLAPNQAVIYKVEVVNIMPALEAK